MAYRVHRFDMRMTHDGDRLERFLNGLKGEIVSIIPNVGMTVPWHHRVDFVLVVEKVE